MICNNRIRKTRLILALLASLLVVSCSSAPKRPPEVFANRNAAIAQMELAHKAVMKHEPDVARQFLAEAWRLAVSTDDAETRARVLLATGNAWYSEGSVDHAAQMWEQAKSEAAAADLVTMVAAANVYIARGNLAEGHYQKDMEESERKRRAEESRSTVLTAQNALKDNPLYTAFAWRVLALAEKELGNTEAAIAAIDESIDIHGSGQYLEDAAYDWYIKASILSKAEQYPAAVDALNQALGYDRRAENSAGIGRDWMAIGAVREKSGDADGARAARTRARDIFRAAFLAVQAQEAETLLTQ